jgi:hypothetical protein
MPLKILGTIYITLIKESKAMFSAKASVAVIKSLKNMSLMSVVMNGLVRSIKGSPGLSVGSLKWILYEMMAHHIKRMF